MKPSKEQIEGAMALLRNYSNGQTIYEGHPLWVLDYCLRVLQKLMEDPSEGMHDNALLKVNEELNRTGNYAFNPGEIFKAMCEKLLEEVDSDV